MTHSIIRTTSVTELRDRLAETIDTLTVNNAVMVVRHSRPAAYLLSPEFFEELLARIESLEQQDISESTLIPPSNRESVQTRMEL